MEIFALGACLLHGPLSAALKQGSAVSSFSRFPGGGPPSVYSIDEAIQLTRFVKGEIGVPEELRPFLDIRPSMQPSALAGGGLATADVVILEINSPVRMIYRGYYLVRTELMDRIFGPLRQARPETEQAINAWYYQGLMHTDEAARQSAAKALLAAMPKELEDRDLICSILAETYGSARDAAALTEGIATLREVVGDIPLGMMTYTHQYMPDGRPLAWPPEFADHQVQAATALGVPFIQPSRIVRQLGVTNALRDDRIHYLDQFQPVMGQVLTDFAAHAVGRPAT